MRCEWVVVGEWFVLHLVCLSTPPFILYFFSHVRLRWNHVCWVLVVCISEEEDAQPPVEKIEFFVQVKRTRRCDTLHSGALLLAVRRRYFGGVIVVKVSCVMCVRVCWSCMVFVLCVHFMQSMGVVGKMRVVFVGCYGFLVYIPAEHNVECGTRWVFCTQHGNKTDIHTHGLIYVGQRMVCVFVIIWNMSVSGEKISFGAIWSAVDCVESFSRPVGLITSDTIF